MATYSWKTRHAAGKLKASVVARELERIRRAHRGRLQPEDVVEAAKPRNAVLHPAFEWNDTEAARKYRLVQATRLILSVVVITDEKPDMGPVRAFCHVTQEDDEAPSFLPLAVAMSKDGTRSQVLKKALKEVKGWRRRYAEYTELAEVFAVVDSVA